MTTSRPQPDCPLIGTWSLVGWRDLVDEPTSPAPAWHGVTGQIIYTADGTMSMQMSERDRDRFAGTEPTLTEKARAFNECHAYSGTFTHRDARVIHHVRQSNAPNYIGTDQIRFVDVDASTLVLTNESRTRALTWERVTA
ncbi:lipocalin-like domain-containing protein [Desertimonas flava]|uniref:lipocalin-like domain-containing protein n=1 Tax=Desertimonas flava TaxID=2064846 RepID=UPI0013C45FD9|nr:lipocalin-like domain-containing protein [Desertimonas flava]